MPYPDSTDIIFLRKIAPLGYPTFYKPDITRYIYICMHIYVYVYTYICIYICLYIYMYVYIYMSIFVYVYIYIYVYICICRYIYIYVYICIHVYVYIIYIITRIYQGTPQPPAKTCKNRLGVHNLLHFGLDTDSKCWRIRSS